MTQHSLDLRAPARTQAVSPAPRPLGRILVENGVITDHQLVMSLHLQHRLKAPIGEILIAEGCASADAVMQALSEQHRIRRVDLFRDPPEQSLSEALPYRFWLRHRVVPWLRIGDVVLVATSRPDSFDKVRQALAESCPNTAPVLATDDQIMTALARRYADRMAIAASARVAPQFSCRTWHAPNRYAAAAFCLCILATALSAPQTGMLALLCVALFALTLFMSLRIAGLAAHLATQGPLTEDNLRVQMPPGQRLPAISVLVPLFREREIAGTLIRRLSRLSYPKALLDVILVLEEHDDITRRALAAIDLPAWMRVIEVPAHGGLTTKPRAMNYALDFCRGDIIGVWDAEDAPSPDQLHRVAERFAEAPDEVVCLQGVLDYYNPRTNWLARCFTIEYSSWFRLVLPGIARLGLVVPLGGTTLFFRRDKLEELGGWDAHNVTEDADLGVRLCRAGYRTEMIGAVTQEEANCRAWPWIKQRSRWIKGFMITYLVHMRHPSRLYRDLGAWRFFGFQAFFLGTCGQFLLAPLLWTMWLMLLGLPHPLSDFSGSGGLTLIISSLIVVELIGFCIGAMAVTAAQRRYLIPWAATMILYYPLGTLAAYKALYELVFRPFYWDKTQHGIAAAETTAQG